MNVSWLLDTRKDTIETKVPMFFLVCKGLSIDGVGVSRDTEFQEIRPVAGFETADLVIEKVGGATVERLFVYAARFQRFQLQTALGRFLWSRRSVDRKRLQGSAPVAQRCTCH